MLREKLPAFLANFLPQLVLSRQTLIIKKNAIGQQENIILYVNFLYVLRFLETITKSECTGLLHCDFIFEVFLNKTF